MYDIPLKQVIDASLAKIGSVADVNTVIGDPITTPDGITIIPFSKVSVGYASGGADYDGKNAPAADSERPPHFAGGNGAGVSVVPLGFLVINKGDVRMLDLKHDVSFERVPDDPVNKALDSVNGIIEKAPSLVNKLKDIFSKKKNSGDDKAE